MKRLRMFALLAVAAHWVVAIWHLFLAARVLPAPNDHVSGLAVALITSGHAVVSMALWKLGDRFAGLASLIFFVAALGADLYEHFLHASANNVFMVSPGGWTAWFEASVILLVALEVLGCFLTTRLVGGSTRNSGQQQVAKSGTQANTASGLKMSPVAGRA